jgi:hypothetical protein
MRAMASGSEVVLEGRAMVGLIRAADGLGQSGLERYVIVGGVAVAARLGQAHRGTTDVVAVVDEVAHPDAVEALLELPSARRDPTGAHRVRVAGTKVELIGVWASRRQLVRRLDRATDPLRRRAHVGPGHGHVGDPDSGSRSDRPGHGAFRRAGRPLRYETPRHPGSSVHEPSRESESEVTFSPATRRAHTALRNSGGYRLGMTTSW